METFCGLALILAGGYLLIFKFHWFKAAIKHALKTQARTGTGSAAARDTANWAIWLLAIPVGMILIGLDLLNAHGK